MSSTISHETFVKIIHRMNPRYTLNTVTPMIGGISAQVYLLDVTLDTALNSGQTQKMLLRAHGEDDRTRNPNIAQDEFKLLQVLHSADLPGRRMPVAKPYHVDSSGDLLPIPYLIVEFIEGAASFSPQNIPDFLRQCAEMLAHIHSMKYLRDTLAFLPDQSQHALWWIRYQPETLDESLQEPRLRTKLREAFPLKQVNDATLLHGDFWMGNFIWKDEKLSGVIDWEDAAWGDPLADLAITRLEMLWAFGEDAMHDFTRLYHAQNPALDRANQPYWDLFAALRPANRLAEWAAVWVGYGRPDITEEKLRADHRWFVKQAFEAMS